MSSEIALAARSSERRILRRAAVELKTGMSCAHIYALMRKGEFPKPVRIGRRAVGWDSVELDQWISQRVHARI